MSPAVSATKPGVRRRSAAEVGGYPAHRERQRRRILAAAEMLFTRDGIERVSMLEITSAAGVQPSTLYQYFKRKEDLVWAITGEIFRDFHERSRFRMEGTATGLERITTLLQMMAEELEERPDKVRFMAEFDVLYARHLPAEPLLQLERQLGFDLVEELRRWVAQGIADGSLRPDLNPETTLHAVLNAAVGTQRRLASFGPKIAQEYGQTASVLFRETVRIVLLGLQAEPAKELPQQGTGEATGKKETL